MSNSPLRNNAHASANGIRVKTLLLHLRGRRRGLRSENRKVHRVSSSLCHCTLSINLQLKPLVIQTPANCRPYCPVGPWERELNLSNTHLYNCQQSTPHSKLLLHHTITGNTLKHKFLTQKAESLSYNSYLPTSVL